MSDQCKRGQPSRTTSPAKTGGQMGVLRILLAICVFCAHSRPLGHLRWLGGDLAVELFFVISGFYMQLILRTKYTKHILGNRWVIHFYKARYFRLLPLYIFGSILSVGAAAAHISNFAPLPIWKFLWDLPNTIGNLLFKMSMLFSNITMILQDLVMFVAVHHENIHWAANFSASEQPIWQGLIIPPAWSLGVELSFYVIAPYLLNLRTQYLVAYASFSLTTKVLTVTFMELGDPWTYRFFPFELGYFLLGALACRHRHLFESFVGKRIQKFWYCVYPLVFGFAVVRVPVPLIPVAYPMALACVLPLLFRLTAANKLDRLIGELSYPFYILHWLCLSLAGLITLHLWHGVSKDAVVPLVGLALTISLSVIGLTLEMWLVEPWRSRLSGSQTFQPVLATAA